MNANLKITLFLTVILFLSLPTFSQTQKRIPWPSLADGPWPVARGDVQGTGRSEYIGPDNPQIILEQTYLLWESSMGL
ncbi:MAG: hypothetical protein U5K00_18780 [Melioribacteraceae bacterium]|nr:hypothetical protein [Melioribacteraceae bacterium]